MKTEKYRRFSQLKSSFHLISLGFFFLMSCDEKKTESKRLPSRVDLVTVQNAVPTVSTNSKEPPHAQALSASSEKRRLCEKAPTSQGKTMPAFDLASLVATSEAPMPKHLPTEPGKWTWINMWAAWCAPCKEEIPRLRAFEAKLRQNGKAFQLQFLSLDDDMRQAKKFLDAEPTSGLRRSFWLTEGGMRNSFLEHFRLKSSPELPMQLLFDPAGKLSCVIEGAIEENDLPEMQKLFHAL